MNSNFFLLKSISIRRVILDMYFYFLYSIDSEEFIWLSRLIEFRVSSGNAHEGRMFDLTSDPQERFYGSSIFGQVT